MIGWNIWYYNRYGEVIEANSQQVIAEQGSTESAVDSPVKPTTPADELIASPTITEDGDSEGSPFELTNVDPTIDPTAIPEEPVAQRAEGEQTISIDTGITQVEITNIGGVITSWKLTTIHDEVGQLVELVNQEAMMKPLSLEFSKKSATAKINKAQFFTDAPSSMTLSEQKPTGTVTLNYRLDSGFEIKKVLTFYYDSYRMDADISISHSTAQVAGSAFGVGWYGLTNSKDAFYSYDGPVIYIDGKRLEKLPDTDEPEEFDGDIDWGGLKNRYYNVTFFPEDKRSKITTRQYSDKNYSVTLRLVSLGNSKPIRFSVYGGPNTVHELKKMGRGFQKMINYGWFDIIAKPIYRMLIWINSIIGNFGWSIIIITAIIRILFYPLQQKSFESMAKMRKLQPQMKIIQERYKKDKQKMNEELMALYKKHHVNPLAGCLPIFLQIPVFIALYKVLLGSIELQGAEFIWWIHDLSLKDPYYVTPILMGLSMFLQQRLSPQATDPVQRNVMLLMPVVFTVMFLNFPSGLVIYWLVSNILSIAQQWNVNRTKEEV